MKTSESEGPLGQLESEDATAKWVIGQDTRGEHDYIVHTGRPAFVAKIGHDANEGVLSGLSYGTSSDRNIYDFVWFDRMPRHREFLRVMKDAEEALTAYLESAGVGGPDR